MPKALSVDLRQRVVNAYKAGEGTLKQIATRFDTSTSSVKRWLKLDKERGSLEAMPHSGGRANQKLFDEHIQALKLWLDREPDLYLAELADKLKEEYDITIDPSQLCRILNREHYGRKKK